MEKLQQLLENKLMSMQPCPSAVAQGFNYMLPQQMSMTPQSLQILPQMVGNSQEVLPMPSSSYQGRLRTIFTKEQVAVMEAIFQLERYPEGELRRRIAEELDLHETRITTWYKNRRAKERQNERQIVKMGLTPETYPLNPIKVEPVDEGYQPQPVSVLLSDPDHTPVTSPAESSSTVL